ncbi:hypothetical protein [Slackia sp.]|uniref:hypothetical protein n=1 Tax=Slackia sp. TaxID=2049041 RepID=UPI00280AFE17|nr:hypothetical protein [uncultured Slackia sp.]
MQRHAVSDKREAIFANMQRKWRLGRFVFAACGLCAKMFGQMQSSGAVLLSLCENGHVHNGLLTV